MTPEGSQRLAINGRAGIPPGCDILLIVDCSNGDRTASKIESASALNHDRESKSTGDPQGTIKNSEMSSIESRIGNVERENSPTTGSFPSLHPLSNTGLNKELTSPALFGWVAKEKDLLNPAQIVGVLEYQQQKMQESGQSILFGEACVTMGFLTHDQRNEILAALVEAKQHAVSLQRSRDTVRLERDTKESKSKSTTRIVPATRASPTFKNDSSKRTPARPGTRTSWSCSKCKKPLGAQSVVNGAARIIGANLICVECIQTPKADAQGRKIISTKILWIVLAVSLTLLIPCAIFFPAQVLFLAALAALVSVITGILGFTLGGKARFLLVTVGVFAGIASHWCISLIQEQAVAQQLSLTLGSDAADIKQLLNEDEFRQAHNRFLMFKSKAAAEQEHIKAASRIVLNVEQAFDDWFRLRYGADLTLEGRNILETLMNSYTVKISSGGVRFRSFQIDESGHAKKILITAALDGQQGGSELNSKPVKNLPCEESVLMQAASILATLVDAPGISEVEMLLISADDTGEKIIGTFLINRSQKPLLQSGEAGKIFSLCRPQR